MLQMLTKFQAYFLIYTNYILKNMLDLFDNYPIENMHPLFTKQAEQKSVSAVTVLE